VRAGDLRLWLFVGLFLVVLGFLIYATVAAGGF
jgi:hypothetical protein